MGREPKTDPAKRDRTPAPEREPAKREAPGQRDEKHPMDVGSDADDDDEDDDDLIDDDSDDLDEGE